ncbi:MAG: ketosteroid isomerase [Caulobacteraceae bacterium]|nr:nuclear transport factor 2 family protein [Caulobacter sp.]RYF92770.1 MAG: ketosteroid isomerase [Caulobacteraceae bacterium]
MQTRRALIETLYEAYNRRDVAALVAALDPGVEWTNQLDGELLKGPEAVAEFWKSQFEVMLIEASPVAFEDLPDGRVAVSVAQTMRRADGQLWGSDHVTHTVTFGPSGLILKMEAS